MSFPGLLQSCAAVVIKWSSAWLRIRPHAPARESLLFLSQEMINVSWLEQRLETPDEYIRLKDSNYKEKWL